MSNGAEETFKCELCPKTFSEKRYLTKHVNRLHPNGQVKKKKDNSMQCPICKKTFPRFSHLSRHQLSCMNIRSFECPFCEEKFQQKPHLLRHVGRRHPNEDLNDLDKSLDPKKTEQQQPSTSKNCDSLVQKHLCIKCGHIFTDKHDLLKHVRNLHHPLVCHHCNGIFYGNAALKKHELMTRTARYTCSCGASFGTIRTLRNHENACRRRGEFMCIEKECKQLFCQRVQLDRHWNKVHFTHRNCPTCSFKADAPLRMAKHVEMEHQKKICGYCSLEYPDEKHVALTHWKRLKKPVSLVKKTRKKDPKASIELEDPVVCNGLSEEAVESAKTDIKLEQLDQMEDTVVEESDGERGYSFEVPEEEQEPSPALPSYVIRSEQEGEGGDTWSGNIPSISVSPLPEDSKTKMLNLRIQVPPKCSQLILSDHITNEMALAFPELSRTNVLISEDCQGQLLSLNIPVPAENLGNCEKWLEEPIYL